VSSLLYLVPDAYNAHGGVQAYMRRLAEILSAFAAERGGFMGCVSLADSEWKPEGHSLSVSYDTFAGARGSKAAFARKAASIAKKHRPDIAVIGHVGLAPVALALKLAGLIPAYIVVLHGWEAWRRLGPLSRLAAARAARIVSTTEYTAREFCRLNGVAAERVCVVPLAIPKMPAAPQSTAAAGGLSVLTVSRLVQTARYKGIDTLMEAVSWACSANVPIRVTVAGGGDDLPRLRRRAAELGLEESFSFPGPVADAQLQRLYRECDAFVLPSKSEGFGIVFLEAMAHGKPCIGGNHGGTPEVIDDGRDGFLVDFGDVEKLAERLMRLAKDPDLLRQMGERARRKVLENFLFPHMRERWFSLLSQVESTASLENRVPALPRAAGAVRS
jgi:phosphatidyl-myo-inositol dimannoside synthase